MNRADIGDWVVKIGSSKPSSGIAHLVDSTSGDRLVLRCGRRLTQSEILDVLEINDTSQDGLCLVCTGALRP